MQTVVKESNTSSIQEAINATHECGGGCVTFEPGIYEIGTIYLKSNVELNIPAGVKLQGYSKPDLYDDFSEPGFSNVTPENSKKCLIACSNSKNISITGCGEINGQGPEFYDRNVPEGHFYTKPPYPRPRMIQFFNCENVKIEDVSLIDSPGWTCWFVGCRHMSINRIKIRGDQAMVNNDGIDFDGCSKVTVSDSFFQTGDDCLVLRAIRRDSTNQFVCENIIVNNCVLNSKCQGVRIGCPSDDTIRNCAFRNIIFNGEGTGINCNNPYRYLRKNCEGYLSVENITFSNWQLKSKRKPFSINIEEGITLRKIDNIVFENFNITAKKPIELAGTANTHLNNITLRNIYGTIEAESPIIATFVKDLNLSDIRLSAISGTCSKFERKESNSWESMF